MNVLLRIYPGDDWGFLAVNVVLQVTVIIIVAWLLAQLDRRWNAAWRYTVYCAALIWVLASPVLAYLMQATEVPLIRLAVGRATPAAESLSISQPAAESAETPVHGPTTSAPPNFETLVTEHGSNDGSAKQINFVDFLRTIGGCAQAVWALGMVWLLVRWCYGLHIVAVLRRDARRLDDSMLAGLMGHIRGALGSDRLPPVAVSARVDRPIMIGLVRPLVILPDDVLHTLQESELADVLVHECAHAVCRHQFVSLLQRLAQMLFWPHPLVHFLNRELARAREELCDNFVLHRNSAPSYVRTLLDLSQSLGGTCPKSLALGLFPRPWPLEDRIADLLDRRRKTMTRIHRSGVVGLTIVLFLPAVLIAGTKIVQAAAIEDRSVNKKVKDFPEQTDLSTPESVMAAWSRCFARADSKGLLELSWVTLDAESTKSLANDLKHVSVDKSLSQKALDTEICEVLTYNDDLAAVIVSGNFLPNDAYSVRHFGRINGQWKSLGWRDNWYFVPSLDAAEERFDAEKDTRWQEFEEVRDDVANGNTPIAKIEPFVAAPALSAQEKEEIKRWQAETWQLAIELHTPSQEPKAVQFAILDEDPVPAYRERLKARQESSRKQLEKANNESRKNLLRGIQMSVTWDQGFKNVTGDKLHLLTNPTSGTVMSSNGPGGEKWVVTKTVGASGKLICWCIPVEVKIGERVTISLNKDNTFDLQTPYDEVMNPTDNAKNENELKQK